MRAIITIDMDGAAFEDGPTSELGRILGRTISMAHRGEISAMLLDSNGNACGTFEIVE